MRDFLLPCLKLFCELLKVGFDVSGVQVAERNLKLAAPQRRCLHAPYRSSPVACFPQLLQLLTNSFKHVQLLSKRCNQVSCAGHTSLSSFNLGVSCIRNVHHQQSGPQFTKLTRVQLSVWQLL